VEADVLRSRFLAALLPSSAVLGGLALSVVRFRAQDPVGGLALGLGGMLLMIVLTVLLPGPERPS
jgi:hypothetical protein